MHSGFDLSGKIALVTGSSQGLGLVMAQGLSDAGATIILNGRHKGKLENVELTQSGRPVHLSVFDVTNEKQIQNAVQQIEKNVGPIDILVNNAGINRRFTLESFPLKAWQEIIDTNLKGAFLVSRSVARSMIQRKSGKIINICSMQSELGRETISPYAASKGGLKMLTRGMATEWGQYNIQVNGLGPGYFKTHMTRKLWENPEFDKWLCQRSPSHRWGHPDELIGPLIFLASDASSYVNGHILYVDGGLLASI
jgi:gluconate 5-dehydrogenase